MSTLTQMDQISRGQGFIAALDQSGGSSPKALAEYGISTKAYHSDAEMFTLIHDMLTSNQRSTPLRRLIVENAVAMKFQKTYANHGLADAHGAIPVRGAREDSAHQINDLGRRPS